MIFVGFWALLGCSKKEVDPAPPSVMLVILDTLRGSAGPALTPNLSRLGAAGATWTDAHTAGTWSWPSHASIFLGVPPWEHGAHFDRGGKDAWQTPDPYQISVPRDDLPTLAARFADSGYNTVLATANVWLDQYNGLDTGFRIVQYDKINSRVVELVEGGLTSAGEDPLFLTVNLMTAHGPYSTTGCDALEPHRAVLEGPELGPLILDGKLSLTLGATRNELPVFRFARGELVLSSDALAAVEAVYGCAAQRADAQLGQLIDMWRHREPGAIIAVTSDHGEMLGEHGQFGHGRSVWPELSHIPLVIAAPGKLEAGSRFDETVMLHGLKGTLLELAGFGRESENKLEAGPRVVKAWSDALWAKHVGGAYEHDASVVADGGYARLVWGDRVELYNLKSDPKMTTPIDNPAEMARLATLESFGEWEGETEAPKLDAATLKDLEALGYVQ